MGKITVGGFVSFLAYSNQYTKPFNEISGVVTELQNALACAARLFELIDEQPEESDEGKKKLSNPKGEVSFNNVTFSYDKSKTLIKNFDFTAYAGRKIAVVGTHRLRQNDTYKPAFKVLQGRRLAVSRRTAPILNEYFAQKP